MAKNAGEVIEKWKTSERVKLKNVWQVESGEKCHYASDMLFEYGLMLNLLFYWHFILYIYMMLSVARLTSSFPKYYIEKKRTIQCVDQQTGLVIWWCIFVGLQRQTHSLFYKIYFILMQRKVHKTKTVPLLMWD